MRAETLIRQKEIPGQFAFQSQQQLHQREGQRDLGGGNGLRVAKLAGLALWSVCGQFTSEANA